MRLRKLIQILMLGGMIAACQKNKPILEVVGSAGVRPKSIFLPELSDQDLEIKNDRRGRCNYHLFELDVSDTGSVESIKLLATTGQAFEKAALDSLERFVFEKAHRASKPRIAILANANLSWEIFQVDDLLDFKHPEPRLLTVNHNPSDSMGMISGEVTIRFEPLSEKTIELTSVVGTPPGLYELRARSWLKKNINQLTDEQRQLKKIKIEFKDHPLKNRSCRFGSS